MEQFVSVLGAITVAALTAAVTYWFTKQRERAAEIRKEKMEHYKGLIQSLNAFLYSVSPAPSDSAIFAGLEGFEDWKDSLNSSAATDQARAAFTTAVNKTFIIASDDVVVALMKLMDVLKDTTTQEQVRWDAVNQLIEKIRLDLGASKSPLPVSIKLAA